MIKSLLSSAWFTRLNYFNKLVVGFSGGLDSSVLLHVLAMHQEDLPELVPVHVNHGISENAHLWQTHCEQFCNHLKINLITESVHFERSANREEGARIARYNVFSSLMTAQDCLILGHHLDDQAETVLLQLFRGAGIDGLAAMSEVGQLGSGGLARPFLSHRREHLEHYAKVHHLRWIEDESNQDRSYSRNFLRQEVLPLLKKKWPSVVGNLARTAVHCQAAKRNLDALAASDLLLEQPGAITSNALGIEPLKKFSYDRVANILRVWLKKNQVQVPSTATFHRLIDEVIAASPDAAPEVGWGDVVVRRYQQHLYLDKKTATHVPSCIEWSGFPLMLTVGHTQLNLVAKKAHQGLAIPQGAKIFIKFRRGGERIFWHGQNKYLKKLFQEWGVPPWLRDTIPLVYFDNTLAAVVGYAMSDLFYVKESSAAWIFLNHSA